MVNRVATIALGALLLAFGGEAPVRGQQFERGPESSPHLSINIACTSCHTSTSWSPLRGVLEFDHNRETKFALRGLHEKVQCKSCHATLEFTKAGTGCADCHADIHRRQFGARCDDCHTVKGWRAGVQAVQAHRNRFPLLGAHAAADCESCHRGAASARFTGLSTDCSSCHLTDYQQPRTFDHKASNVSLNCAQCHGMDNWRAARFDHAQVTRFPLNGAHARVECSACHTTGAFSRPQPDCFSCHSRQFASAKTVDHVKAGFPRDCTGCHATASWQGGVFDHSARTRFPLAGAHVRTSCTQCHAGGLFAGARTDCYGCHIAKYEAASNPNHAKSSFPTDCRSCHTVEAWQGAKFDHVLARFQLTGAHASAACSQCHAGGRYTGTSSQCSSCHLAIFQKTSSPNHVAAGFPQDCGTCHTTIRWQGTAFDHNTRMKFPLTGAHAQVTCAQCHTGGVFAGTSSQCQGCHLADFQKAANPNHVAAAFPQDCAVCHTTTRWQGAAFEHNTKTKFPLTGAHVQTSCAQCHASGVYAGTASQCQGCHLADFQKAANPNHVAAGFPQDCAACHTTARWQGAAFDHNIKTKFRLTGAHVQTSCAQCHTGGVFAGAASQCQGCHLADFQKAANPNHVAAAFPQDCAVCHTTTRWQGGAFNHSTSTKFQLTGAHGQLPCSQCHVNGRYAGLAAQCASCHLGDYQKTANPNHASAGFPQDCSVCHTTTRWQGGTFNHTTSTKFQLTGAHTQASCSECHTGGKYAGTSSQCSNCHIGVFQKTTNPNHVTAGFPQDCSVCHTTTRWSGATFNHSSGRFPLTGAHTQSSCAQCHTGGKYAGTPTQCSTCHLGLFQKTTSPNHVAAGFPQDCAACHTTTRWTGATFDHNARTRFRLTGAHPQVACAQCHVGGRYAGTSTQCASCHLGNFQRTTNPNHVSAGFPQDCSVCHTTTRWAGAAFNHSSGRFPLTGAHTQVSCAQCHVNGRFSGTSSQCASCHLGRFQQTTSPNHVAAGFPQDCAACHTTTRWQGASFDHNARTRFPLTGAHTQAACAGCHIGGRYAGTSTQCQGCHLANYQRTTNPNHVAASFPQDCSVCHSTTRWSGASFNHSTGRFPLTGAHVQASCTQCHVGGRYTGTSTQCAGCHLSTYQGTTNPNHAAAGFPQDCSVCHTTTRWSGASFNHSSTSFPLTGRHTSAQCSNCHTGGVYNGLSTACATCHLTNYQRTTNPNHVSAGFPQQCNTCHTTSGWTPATFSHSTTRFALTGVHLKVPCANCHVGGRYAGTPTACYSCHTAAYNSTTNPGHAAAGFPTTCQTCHTTTGWSGATFNHTWFPRTHNSARTCGDCHTNPSNYTVFTCTSCHSKSSTDSHHSGRSGYVYNSANCYQCHPNGRS